MSRTLAKKSSLGGAHVQAGGRVVLPLALAQAILPKAIAATEKWRSLADNKKGRASKAEPSKDECDLEMSNEASDGEEEERGAEDGE